MTVLVGINSEEAQNLIRVFDQYITSKTSVALSTLLNESITHNVKILECGISDIKDIKLDPDEIKMCAVRLNGKGDTHIEILYTIQQKHAKKIAAKLLCQNEVCEIDEMGASAIQEVANIMTGSFFNALSNGTGFRVDLSTPNYTNDELHSLIDTSVKDIAKPVEHVVITDVELIGKSSETKLHMIIIQNTMDARKLLANHSDQIKEQQCTFGQQNSELDALLDGTDLQSYPVGGQNSELDALIDDALKEK
ncbi:chemotaxis protein CheC [Candidatus Nitrosotenuis chungbukensis]|uniref:chemotaxis protein CheC n=1 Tax=Candidatus Nitrosotenuis chungbukensis TaxID=1353246 RepID=UPI0012FEC0B9|nr:chemotaxis protein CheC [Candidatus Nitrosotenuis chungbukensis]